MAIETFENLPIVDTGGRSLIAQLRNDMVEQDAKKISFPNDGADFGNSGDQLRSLGDGGVEWAAPGMPTYEQTEQAISDWLDAHPEATTTVADGAITDAKLNDALKRGLVYGFETVADMKAATTLKAGMICRTNGFHSSGDGGAAWYKITDTGTANEMDIIACGDLFANYIYDSYLTPNKFGAYSNSDFDSSDILQHCIDYVSLLDSKTPKNVYIINTLYLSQTINVKNGVSIVGVPENERYTSIKVDPNIGTVFSCLEAQNKFKNISIKPTANAYYDFNAIYMKGINGTHYDIDSDIVNVSIGYCNKAILIEGKNVNVDTCMLVHCRYGVYYDVPADGWQFRGLNIVNTRFHGIGEELEIQYENSACVYINTAIRTNVTIKNCIADQGGTFFYGFASDVNIQNNYVETWVKPCMYVTGQGTPTLGANWLIEGNKFYGNSGVDPLGIERTYPDYVLYLSDLRRANFIANDIGKANLNLVYLHSPQDVKFIANNFGFTQTADSAAIYVNGSISALNLIANTNSTVSSNSLIDNQSNSYISSIHVSNNFGFKSSNYVLTEQQGVYTDKFFLQIGSGTTNAPMNDVYMGANGHKFILVRTNYSEIYEFTRFRNDCMVSTPFMIDNQNIGYAKIQVNSDSQVTPRIYRHNIANGTITELAVPVYLYKILD